ncbi:restriction endonuclease subunit S [Algibacter sp. L1A34]|uniref:restriction endonuclease subunit S n=1 Tax=Algibacter sp. L1A34 TaxID=2686365 RepID=UPI00131CE46A|nr:restriction endonuclease subunit S [Algibacter sp. L1A34]
MVEVENKVQRYEKYKNSGVEWLGEIPEHWELKRLKYVFTILKRISGELGHDVLSITQSGIKVKDIDSGSGQLSMDYSKYQLVFQGDFAMNHMDLLTGYVDLSKYDGVISPDYRVFNILDTNCDRNYLLILLQLGYQSKVFYAHGQGVSMLGRWRFPADNFNNFIFPIPPLSEQTKIAQFLDDKTRKIDDAIAIKEQQIHLLKERKQILIHKAVTRGLNDSVTLKDSGVEWIGEIPEHWEVKKIKHVTSKIGSGVTPSGGGTTYLDKGIPLLRSQNIFFDKIELDGVAFISDKVHQSMSNSQVFKGDVLLNITGGSIGRCYFVNIDIPLNVNQHVCILRPNEKITTLYLNRLIASEVGQNQIWFHQQGGGREGLNFQALKNFSIPFPSLSEQKEISAYIETASQKIETAIGLKQQEIEKLKEYKSSLINGVVTGKVRVC